MILEINSTQCSTLRSISRGCNFQWIYSLHYEPKKQDTKLLSV